MKKKHAQLLNFLIIIIGAILVIIGIASEGDNKYFKIFGIVFLMFGLYRATNEFVSLEEERKKEDKDEES